MKLRPLTAEDLTGIATVHVAAFPRTVASRLGVEAARRQYESLMRGPSSAAGMGAFEQERLVGFCFVGLRHASEYEFVRENARFLAWRLCSRPWLLADSVVFRRLGVALKIFGACRFGLLKKRGAAEADGSGQSGCSYGIQYLAVDPLHRGRGLGQKLVASAETLALQHGFSEIQLSVAPDNAAAIALYLRMGWQKSSPSGQWLGLMSRRLVTR